MRLLFITIILFFEFAHFAVGQLKSTDTIPADKLGEELTILETTLKEIHPSLYRYTSQEKFEQDFLLAKESLTEDLTVFAFLNLIAPIVADINCGHTYMLPSYINADTKLFPFEIKIIDTRLYIIQNYSSNKTISLGSEVIKINGKNVSWILDELYMNTSSDGYIETYKHRNNEEYFKSNYATYIEQPDTFNLELKHLGSPVTYSVPVFPLAKEKIDEAILDLKQNTPQPLDIDNINSLAILRIHTFGGGNFKISGKSFKKFIDQSFSEIIEQGIKNLIIDVRNNHGGRAWAPPYLFSYLTTENFYFKERLEFRHGYNFTYTKYINRNKISDKVNRGIATKIGENKFEWKRHENTKLYDPSQLTYHGNIYILMNGGTASAGGEFTALAHSNNVGTFIGEESGGDYNGVNGYDRTWLELPYSKLRITIPGWRSIMAWNDEKYFGKGTPPDYQVGPDIYDIVHGVDTELEFVINLIKKESN